MLRITLAVLMLAMSLGALSGCTTTKAASQSSQGNVAVASTDKAVPRALENIKKADDWIKENLW